MPSRQNTRIIVAALFLSVATTVFVQSGNQKWQAIAASEQIQLAQEQPSVPTETIEEEYSTRLFDMSGEELAQFEGRFYRFSSDGQRLLTLSSGFQLQYLFDVSGRRLLQFKANIAEFSPDGQRLVVTFNGVTYLYDATGQELAQLPGSLTAPIFSPNGQQAVIFAEDSAYLIDISGQQIAQIPGRFLNVGSGFDATSQRFILYRSDNPTTCDLFDSSGQTIVRLPEECAGVSPDRQVLLLAIGTLDDSSLHLYDFSGQEIAQLSAASYVFSSDSRFILTTDLLGGSSSYLHNSSGEEIAQLQGTFGRFSSTGQRLVAVSGNTVHLYDLSGNEIAQMPGHFAAFLPESDKFITYLSGENENRLDLSGGETRLFDSSGQELALLTGDPSLYDMAMFGAGSPSQISQFLEGSFSFLSVDGQRIATSDEENSYLYDASGNQIAVLPGVFLSFSPTGQHLITSKEGKIYLFDRSGVKLMEVEGTFASFSPDGQRLAISAENALP